MEKNLVKLNENELSASARFLFGRRHYIPKHAFFNMVWQDLATFTRLHRDNLLIQDAVSRCQFLIPHAYTILTIQYGSFSQEPTRDGILREYVSMLSKDLIDEEIRIKEYASKQTHYGMFYPGLNSLLQNIQSIYGGVDFNLLMIPPRTYHAYSLITLNHLECLQEGTPLSDIYKRLISDHTAITQLFSYFDRNGQ